MYDDKICGPHVYAALTHLRKFADQNGRSMRWPLRLSELDFEIEHRPGTRIAHAEVLSRNVGAVRNLSAPAEKIFTKSS
jgi:hypothetical protein